MKLPTFFNKTKKEYFEPYKFTYNNYSDICNDLLYGYTFDELVNSLGYTSQKIQCFKDRLQENNLTLNEGLALYRYTISSNQIFALARNITTEKEIKKNIYRDLKEKIDKKFPAQTATEIYTNVQEFLKTIDMSLPLKTIMKQIEEYKKITHFDTLALGTAVEDLKNLSTAREHYSILCKTLNKTKLNENLILYRAVNPDYLLKEYKDINNLIGKRLKQDSIISTSYTKSGFLKNPGYDLIFEIKANENINGLNISWLSGYSNENEVLLSNVDFQVDSIRFDEDTKKYYATCIAIPKDKEYEQLFTMENTLE